MRNDPKVVREVGVDDVRVASEQIVAMSLTIRPTPRTQNSCVTEAGRDQHEALPNNLLEGQPPPKVKKNRPRWLIHSFSSEGTPSPFADHRPPRTSSR